MFSHHIRLQSGDSEWIVSVDMPSLKEADLYFLEHCTDIEIRSSACVLGLMTRCGC